MSSIYSGYMDLGSVIVPCSLFSGSNPRQDQQEIPKITTTIYTLPDELLLAILLTLDQTCDKAAPTLKLRLVSKRFRKICNEVLQSQFTHLCLQPTSESIERFEQICNHPIFSQGIRQFNYISMLWRPQVKTLKDFKRRRRIRILVKRYSLPKSAVVQAYRDHVNRCTDQEHILATGRHVKSIIGHLSKLPRLEVISHWSVLPTEPRKSLNYPSSTKYRPPYPSHEDPEQRWSYSREVPLRKMAEFELMEQDMGVFWERRFAMFEIVPQLTTFMCPRHLGLELHAGFFTAPELNMESPITRNVLKNGLAPVETFELYICPPSPTRTKTHFKTLAYNVVQMLKAAENLQHLALGTFDENDTTTFHHIVRSCTWPRMKSICVGYQYLFTPPGKYQHRPPLVIEDALQDFAGFLLRHKDTLTRIECVQQADTNFTHDFKYVGSSADAAPEWLRGFRHFLMKYMDYLQECRLSVESPERSAERVRSLQAQMGYESEDGDSDEDMESDDDDDEDDGGEDVTADEMNEADGDEALPAKPSYKSAEPYRRLLHETRLEPHGRFRPLPIEVAETETHFDFGFRRDLKEGMFDDDF